MKKTIFIYVLIVTFFSMMILQCKFKDKTSQFMEIDLSESEEWIINNKVVSIDKTIIVVFSDKVQLFTVVVNMDELPGEHHKKFAIEIAKYAFDNGYYDASKNFNINGKPASIEKAIGVTLIKKFERGVIVKRKKGYRFVFKLDEIL